MTHHFSELLPWQTEQFTHLSQQDIEQRLAHAYLLEGQEGLGKLSFSLHFAHSLLCQAPKNSQACHECTACHLLTAGTHPDLRIVEPQESKNIKIEQVRDALNFMSNTSLRGGRKIIILAPAESMNHHSSNALLKSLEEPATGTLLLLISHQPALLMPTVRSRCQKLKFSRPQLKEAVQWLESKNVSACSETLLRLANGAPLRALHLADEDSLHERSVLHAVLTNLLLPKSITIVDAATQCNKFDIEDNIEGMLLSVADILEYAQSRQQKELRDPDLKGLADKFTQPSLIQALHLFYQQLLNSRQALVSSTNPNTQLMLESLFYTWSNLEFALGQEKRVAS